ncbi:hypothetical protein H0H81_003221 [Sphagnurus paluster]|uniref:E3 ubiquitin protein ligase n=1 Tax=Sphagnurus paluster TaxID=117069 RepID=A0A9P7GWN4_9AGAR|nr:hypothetical protein H0H81_003221 [Sphagnurus paluster]
MASRKRPFSEEEDSAATKKRVLTGRNGSPHVNGTSEDQDEPAEGTNLELFRKEAIFRRMKHYSREHERGQSRIAELERRKHTCEAGLAAMTACWNQLVKTIRPLVSTEDLPEVSDDIFDFTVHIREDKKSDFEKVLEHNMHATQSLVTKLVEASGDLRIHPHNGNALKDSQKAANQCIVLQSQLDIMRSKLQDAEQQKERYHQALLTSESRFERSLSKTVSSIESRTIERKSEAMEEGIEEPQRKPSSPAVSGSASKSPIHTNGISDPMEVDILRDQIVSRERRIMDLERECILQREGMGRLEADLKLLSFEKIAENPHYKVLLDHTGVLQAIVNESRTQITRLTEDLNQLRISRKEWEDGVIAAANQANVELKTMLAKRDLENSRLREQRDQHATELGERKQQDTLKNASSRELRVLVDSRADRIAALESEVARCKARLAAQANDEELMRFFMAGNTEEAVYFESLKERAATAETRVALLEEALSKYQADHPSVSKHMEAEVKTRQRLVDLQAELDKYKAVYGDPSTYPSDSSTLVERLQEKDEELRRLKLLDTQHTQAETSLYAEIDKLSGAWETLDRQLKDKAFELIALEDRLKKVSAEKAKSDNKYFAAVRDKDAVEAERSKLSREVEKQNRVVERLVDSEKNIMGQLSTLEKELSILRTSHDAYKQKVEQLAEENSHWKSLVDAEKKRVVEAPHMKIAQAFHEQEKGTALKRADLRKIEDGLLRTKKELEQKQRQRESSASQNDKSHDELLVR